MSSGSELKIDLTAKTISATGFAAVCIALAILLAAIGYEIVVLTPWLEGPTLSKDAGSKLTDSAGKTRHHSQDE